MIDAVKMESAERTLKVIGSSGTVPGVLFDGMGIDRESFERFARHHLERLRETYPDLDPRADAMLNTTMLHFFLVGASCGRQAGRREG